MTPTTKITRGHQSRDAIVYIRQSSAHQVRKNHESRQRQYALDERAKSLGWPARSIKTIDEDQGRNGSSSAHRQGFKKLLAEIGAGQVGLVLSPRSPCEGRWGGFGLSHLPPTGPHVKLLAFLPKPVSSPPE